MISKQFNQFINELVEYDSVVNQFFLPMIRQRFDEPKENKMDLKKVLARTDTYKVDNEVAIHYELFDWHIPTLLDSKPFSTYIQEHYKSKGKVDETPKVDKTPEHAKSNLNKRLLI